MQVSQRKNLLKKKKNQKNKVLLDILPKNQNWETMILNQKIKIFLALASFMMALAISLGAFGAHGLKSILNEYFLNVYKTGIEYHFYNTLGLFIATFIYALKPESKKIYISLWLIVIGMCIFSFSLYLLAILSMPILGAITPIGGTLLIIAWLTLAYGILKD